MVSKVSILNNPLFRIESSIFPSIVISSKQIRYQVINIPLNIETKLKPSELKIVVYHSNGKIAMEENYSVTLKNNIKIIFKKPSKGKDYYIIYIQKNDKDLFELNVKAITPHVSVHVLRTEQKSK